MATRRKAKKAAPKAARKAVKKSPAKRRAKAPARKKAARAVRAAGKKAPARKPAARAKPASRAAKEDSSTRPTPPMHGLARNTGVPDDTTPATGESSPLAEVREIFDTYDRDRSGQIEATEFARLCDALGMRLSEEELAAGLTVVDSDSDGRISWHEFVGWWQSAMR